MKARYSQPALADLRQIRAWIGNESPAAAQRWLALIRRRVRAMQETPMIGRMVPEFERADLREVFVGTYRIVYQVQEDGIVILTVAEGHQLLKLTPPSVP